jgi:hypothetical protein
MDTRKYFDLNLHLRVPLWQPTSPGTWRAWLPSRGTVLFTLLVVAGLLWASSVGALPLRAPAAASTSTGTIAYQGRLADADGNPLTGTYNMIFQLYDVASGGTPLWTEQWTGSNSVRVSDGLFNVMLGSLAPIPQSVVTGHSSLWLGITVGTDDEMTPRVQLGSVPFAVQALTVPDGSVTTAKLADGAVTGAKIVGGAVASSQLATGAVETSKLADDAVTNAKLAPDSVTQIEAPTLLKIHPSNGNNGRNWRFEVGEVSVGPVNSGSQGSADVTFNLGFASTPKVFVVIHNGSDTNWTQSIAVVEIRNANGFRATVNNQSGRTQTYSVSWVAFGY